MKEISSLLGYRNSVRVVDATMRDGGLCNNFGFTDEFVKDLYNSNIAAGVDYMEVGYKASKKMFDVKEFGKWKFCNDDDILKVIGDNAEKRTLQRKAMRLPATSWLSLQPRKATSALHST